MKKILGLLFVTIYLTACSTAVSDDEVLGLNEQLASLENNIGELEETNEESVIALNNLNDEISNLENENSDLTENNIILEEELEVLKETLKSIQDTSEGETVEVKSYSQTGLLTGPYTGQLVMEAAYDVLAALKLGDMNVFASYVNPVNNIRFSPSQNFDRNNLVELTPTDIINMATDTSIYNWGNEQVTNNPINMTISDYFDQYVYDEAYYQSPIIGQNIVVSSGTVANNVSANFFYSIYNVEFLLEENYTSNAGSEWRSITLSFVVEGDYPELLAVIHGY